MYVSPCSFHTTGLSLCFSTSRDARALLRSVSSAGDPLASGREFPSKLEGQLAPFRGLLPPALVLPGKAAPGRSLLLSLSLLHLTVSCPPAA